MADEGRIKIRRALVSVFDKAGIEVLGKALKEQGVSVISTGGTGKKLAESGESRSVPHCCTPTRSYICNFFLTRPFVAWHNRTRCD